MKIKLICVGNLPPWAGLAYQDYAKRLKHQLELTCFEIKLPKRTSTGSVSKQVEQEGQRMLAHIDPADHVIALDENGSLWDSKTFSEKLQTWQMRIKTLSLLIGGPDGLSLACKQRANQLWSLSPLTFPHVFARLIVIEQLYRAWTLLIHHPYHRP